MQSDELPLADIMDGTIIEQVFEEYEVDFGTENDAVYTPAVTLWALVSQVFFASEQRSCKAAVIRVAALWAALGRRVCDTPANQFEYPQNPVQEEGLGFPILRCVTLTSLFTGMLFDMACGPYTGKETGESALMRELMDVLQPGDTLVADALH